MATTSPDNIRTPNPGDPYNLVPDLQTLAQDVQDALIARGNVFKGTAAQRAAYLSTASPGMLWQDTNDIGMLWKRGASQWVPAVQCWSGTTTQRSAFTQAPEGFQWQDTNGSKYLWVRKSNVWRGVLPLSGVAPTTGAAGDIRSVSISFPAGYFETLPMVQATARTIYPLRVTGPPCVSGVSTTSATLYMVYASASDLNLHWTATP